MRERFGLRGREGEGGGEEGERTSLGCSKGIHRLLADAEGAFESTSGPEASFTRSA
jgi:hypothetical protein